MFKSALIAASTCFLMSGIAACVSPAEAFHLKSENKARSSHVIKIHSLGDAHDSLAQYGYYRVSFIERRYDAYDRVTYKFKACRTGLKYYVYVGWNGDILNTRKVGQCYGYDGWRNSRSHDHNGTEEQRTPYW